MAARDRARSVPATGLAGILADEAGELALLARRVAPTRRRAAVVGLALLAVVAMSGAAGAAEPEAGDRSALEAWGASPAPAASAAAAPVASAPAGSVAAPAASAAADPIPSDALGAADVFGGPDLLDLGLKGGLIVALLFITLRVLRRVQGTTTAPGTGLLLDIVASRPLGPKTQLHLVAIGDRRLVVGQTPAGLVALGELDAAELPITDANLVDAVVMADVEDPPPTPWDRSPSRTVAPGRVPRREARDPRPGGDRAAAAAVRTAADLAAETRRVREQAAPPSRHAADSTGMRVAAYGAAAALPPEATGEPAPRPVVGRTPAAHPAVSVDERVQRAAARARAARQAADAERAERLARIDRAVAAANRAAEVAERAAEAAERAARAADRSGEPGHDRTPATITPVSPAALTPAVDAVRPTRPPLRVPFFGPRHRSAPSPAAAVPGRGAPTQAPPALRRVAADIENPDSLVELARSITDQAERNRAAGRTPIAALDPQPGPFAPAPVPGGEPAAATAPASRAPRRLEVSA